MTVLIVADNRDIIEKISFCLRIINDGVNIALTNNEQKLLDIVDNESTDLVIIDSYLSNIKIPSSIRKIRQISEVPIIILSKPKSENEAAMGLEAGADEFISRQFSPVELMARCRALLRRCRNSLFATDYPLSIDGLTVNFATREVSLDNQPIELTPIEYGLFSELAKHIGKVVRTDEFLNKIWGPKYIGDPNLVKSYIYRLRAKLFTSNNPIRIVNKRGVGYRLVRTT